MQLKHNEGLFFKLIVAMSVSNSFIYAVRQCRCGICFGSQCVDVAPSLCNVCSVVRRIAQYVADILEPEDKDKLYENLLVGQSKVSGL